MVDWLARVQTIVAAFFQMISDTENATRFVTQFPRNIEALVLYGLDIPIEYRAELTTSTASQYLCLLRGTLYNQGTDQEERPLYGLLHVGPPFNIIFVKEDLPLHMRNYVLAHELGHFLADIYIVRNLWLKTLPEQTESILRAFSWQPIDARLELQALIKGLPPRPTTILARGATENPQTIEREISANLIAREVLAPWNTITQLYQTMDKASVTATLHTQFGLPWRVAIDYYDDLRRHFDPHPDMLTRLFSRHLESKKTN
jgi:hypothetical protein